MTYRVSTNRFHVIVSGGEGNMDESEENVML